MKIEVKKEKILERPQNKEIKHHTTKQRMYDPGNKRRNKKYIYILGNKNESAKVQNLQDSAKVVLKQNYIGMEAHLKKQEKSQINNLT